MDDMQTILEAQRQFLYPICAMTALTTDTFRMTVVCPDVAAKAVPGQFVHLLPSGNFSLRRPISICAINRAEGTLTLVFAVRGAGTATLSRLRVGETVNLLGPLGRGFSLLSQDASVLLVGGGIGTPPMLSLAAYYGSHATAICGYRTASAVILQEDFAACGTPFLCCTDDGTAGLHGLVTIPLAQQLAANRPAMVYACGPTPMLRAVADCAAKAGVRCEVSLEERMGCGVGACLVCACMIRQADGTPHAAHVCKDGPVFDAERVIWNG